MRILQVRGIPVRCENGIFTIRIWKVQKNDNFLKFSLSDRLLEVAQKDGAAIRVYFEELGYSVCKPAKEWRRIVLFTEKVLHLTLEIRRSQSNTRRLITSRQLKS